MTTASETFIQSEINVKPLDQVIEDLNKIIDWAGKSRNRNGYFAALYKNITQRIKLGVQKREFEDPERMVDFVVVFAGFYTTAQKQFCEGKLPSDHPWYYVFESGKRKLGIIQHMLLGINVHINYDLANTCYHICPGPEIIYLSKDYFRINLILSSAVGQVEREIFSLSPLLSLIAKFVSKLERKLLDFSVGTARSRSWECACQQAVSDDAGRVEIRKKSEETTEEMSRKVVFPWLIGAVIMFFIKIFEVRGIKKNLEVLREMPVG